MANARYGGYNLYYGSYFEESSSLTQDEMNTNANYIYFYLIDKGWSINSICALLGNMQAESSLNPGRWQNDEVGSTSNGYGLVQWTPASKYIDWCNEYMWDDPSKMDTNLARIVYEVENNLQWIKTSEYDLTFEEFTKGNYTLKFLTESFLINYERPADQSESVKNYRTSLANDWYIYLTGINPHDTPDTPDTPGTTKRKKFNFLLFNARKRRKEWIK